LQLARLCRQPYQRREAAAARLYAAAFAAEPGYAGDLGAGHRYDAARAAALAAAGRGADAAGLDDGGRSRLRGQALGWLRAGPAAGADRAERRAPQARQQVHRTLTRWRQEPALASLRGKAALARLPEVERAAWAQLWAGVDALLKRTRPQPPKE